ncbi:uncharacterized protein LOC117621677 [Prunus dulcis]|uniref:uncharacterized protein LOC117621677 n=1 Tax=Prunus dulcis TaxID=3755 RepID=UPI001482E43B|nr:uncharacterized protein LOC117621677 [Prunus dulcis]
MPFGLKNTRATYQRLVNKIFKKQMGKTIEIYVDNMLVKAPERADYFKNLAEAFSLLQQYRMKLNLNRASNQKEAGAGIVIITLDGTLLEQAITLGFPALNNEAEYKVLLAGLCLAKELSIKKLAIYSDSQLITNQASGGYMAKRQRMILYLDKVQDLLKAFPTFTSNRCPRKRKRMQTY